MLEAWCDRRGRQRIDAIRDGGNSHKQRAQDDALSRRLCVRAQELRQEGCEEQGRLRIQQGDNESIDKDSRDGRFAQTDVIASANSTVSQSLSSEIYQVRSTSVLNDDKRSGGNCQHRGQANRGAECVSKVPQRNARDRRKARAFALR